MLNRKEIDYLMAEFDKMMSTFIINNNADIQVILAILATQLLKGLSIAKMPIEDVKSFFEKILKDYYELKNKDK